MENDRRVDAATIAAHGQDIAVLKNDIQRMNEFFGRLDTAIEKIGDLSNTITKMLAVHDQRLDLQDETNKEIYIAIEKSQTEVREDVRALFTLVNQIRTEVTVTIATLESKAKTVAEDATKGIDGRVKKLERWQWIIIGGGLALAGLPKALEVLAALIK